MDRLSLLVKARETAEYFTACIPIFSQEQTRVIKWFGGTPERLAQILKKQAEHTKRYIGLLTAARKSYMC